MHYIGVDIIEIARVQKVIERWRESFLRRVYTEPELRLYRHQPASLAARFAGKEAVMKALAAPSWGISWREIEILSDATGKPVANLYGKARKLADDLNLARLSISLSHSKENAIAFVIGETK